MERASIVRRTINDPRDKQQQREIVKPTSRNVIAVGCKLPNGMHLDILEVGEPLQRFTLKGTNEFTKGAIIRPASRDPRPYINEDVPKEFFEHWMHLNKNHPAVRNNLIFAHVQVQSVRDMGEEFKQELSGLEPIDPDKPGKGIETRKDND